MNADERTSLYGCWHPAGCQTPGDGCHTPCPVTKEEGQRIELEMYQAEALTEGRIVDDISARIDLGLEKVCTCPETDPLERAAKYTVAHLFRDEPHAVGCPRHWRSL